MSYLSLLLRRTFSTSLQSPTPTTVAADIKSISTDLYKERSLKRLVAKFKKSSEKDTFRKKTGIYEDTIRRLANARRFHWIEEVLEDQKKYKDISKEGFNARLMHLYGRSGMFESAHKVFDEMAERNIKRTVLSFNALLGASVNAKKFDKVEELFKELPKKLEIEPDLVSYNTIMKAYCKMGSLTSAILLLDEMEKKGVKPDMITYNTILYGLYANGKFTDGERIWARMVEKNVSPDLRSYNAKLLGLALEKRSHDAVNLVEEMRSKGTEADMFSFNALIQGFVGEENLEQAKHWYGEMLKNDCKPDHFTYSTLIPFVCEKGDLEFAFVLSKDLIHRKRFVDEKLLQRVVDGLVKESKIEKAKELVKLGMKNGYRHYKLKLPSDD